MPFQRTPDVEASVTSPTGTVVAAARAGFTLVEMLVVLVIIGLIMGLVGPRVLNYLTDAREKTARLQIESFSNALDLFYIDAGRYPTSAEGLAALSQRPPGIDAWNGPYVKGGSVSGRSVGQSLRLSLARTARKLRHRLARRRRARRR